MCTAWGTAHIATICLAPSAPVRARSLAAYPGSSWEAVNCLKLRAGLCLPRVWSPRLGHCSHPQQPGVFIQWSGSGMQPSPPPFFYSDEKHCVSTPCHRELRGRVHADCIVGPLFDDLMAHFHRSPGVSLGQYGAGTAWRNVSP